MQAVLRQSADDVVSYSQTPAAKGGPMPVDTGFLRNSLVTEVNGAQIAQGEDSYTLAIAQLQPGDLLRVGWTAEYARMRNYNPVNGGPFRDAAAARWQEFVDANVRKVRNR